MAYRRAEDFFCAILKLQFHDDLISITACFHKAKAAKWIIAPQMLIKVKRPGRCAAGVFLGYEFQIASSACLRCGIPISRSPSSRTAGR